MRSDAAQEPNEGVVAVVKVMGLVDLAAQCLARHPEHLPLLLRLHLPLRSSESTQDDGEKDSRQEVQLPVELVLRIMTYDVFSPPTTTT